ncbi:hypothetical protein B0J17DRAFT_719267 [Rhizoctonia solani]|nr:hypothetical protein B0J17DRAFT_719267 [Rhizoctonia solani]
MICTKALTMGVDFPNVQLVINYMAPDSIESWGQGAGCGAHSLGIKCICIIMVTKHMVQDACKICKNAGLNIDLNLAKIQVKIEDDMEDEIEAEEQVEDQFTPAAIPITTSKTKRKAGHHQMTLGMATYIATDDCWTKVLDQEFDNLPHTACYDSNKPSKTEEEDLAIELDEAELEHKKPSTSQNKRTGTRTGQEQQCFAEGLESWCNQTLDQLLDKGYAMSLNSIMTGKALECISKSKAIHTLNDFDQPDINWPGHPEWHMEVLEQLDRLQCMEDELAEQGQQIKESLWLEASHKQQAEKEEQVCIKQAHKEEQAHLWQETKSMWEREALEARQVKEESQQALSGPGRGGPSTFSGHGLTLAAVPQAWPLHNASQTTRQLAFGESVVSFSAPVTPATQPGELGINFSVPHTPVSTSSVIPSPVSSPLTPILGPHPVGTLLVRPSGQPILGSLSHLQVPQAGLTSHNQLHLSIPPITSTSSSNASSPAFAIPPLFVTPLQSPSALPEHPTTSTSSMPTNSIPSTSSRDNRGSTSRTKTDAKQRTHSHPPPKGQFKFAPQYRGPPPPSNQE